MTRLRLDSKSFHRLHRYFEKEHRGPRFIQGIEHPSKTVIIQMARFNAISQ